jgi:hypothetical protein
MVDDDERWMDIGYRIGAQITLTRPRLSMSKGEGEGKLYILRVTGTSESR